MEVKEINLTEVLARIAAGETTVEDARLVAELLKMLGLLPAAACFLGVE